MNSQEKDLQTIKSRKNTIQVSKKKPTLKNQIVVMPNGEEIVDVVVGETGTTAA